MKKLTAKKAKELSLEVWEYLAEHSEIYSKWDLPQNTFLQIENMPAHCPLCEWVKQKNLRCTECPLVDCMSGSAIYNSWNLAETDEDRKKYAQMIVDKIKAWEV